MATELKTNFDKEPHVHVRVDAPKVKFKNQLQVLEDVKPREVMKGWIERFDWHYYTERYSHDLDGDTEYLKLQGKPIDDVDYLLTVHVFSCYCEPLNENQDPPF